MVMWEVFRHHGLPDDIISDRGPQFISKFRKHLMEALNVSCKLSSSYHPQTDGQTAQTNQTLEKYLRCFVNYQQDDWVKFLYFAGFAYDSFLDRIYSILHKHGISCSLDIARTSRKLEEPNCGKSSNPNPRDPNRTFT